MSRPGSQDGELVTLPPDTVPSQNKVVGFSMTLPPSGKVEAATLTMVIGLPHCHQTKPCLPPVQVI